MKTDSADKSKGSVLLIALLTITILTVICATSLLVTSQNTSTGMQTGAWQQALTGAEAGIDAAIRALNEQNTGSANPWNNWKTVTGALPTPNPSGSPVMGFTYEPTAAATPVATAPPTNTQYNYLPSSNLSISYPNTEGTTAVSAWVTIDTANGLSSSAGQYYRIRSTGQAVFQSNSVYKRVSNNKLDNNLRNTIALSSNRKGGSNRGPSRTIEVVVQPIPQNARAITLATWLTMSGGSYVDAFNSPNGQWSSMYRDTTYPTLVAEGATGNHASFANTGQTYIYGGVVYSGTAPTNVNANSGNPPVKDVMGQVSTPDNITIPPTSDPTASGSNYNWTYKNPWTGTTSNYSWTPFGGTNTGSTFATSAGTYATLVGGGSPPTYNGNTITTITANGTASAPAMIIINNDFSLSGSNVLTINGTGYVTIWVQGKFSMSGSSWLTQTSSAHVTFIVDKDIQVSGGSATNSGITNSGTAANLNFVATGNSNYQVALSGQSAFTCTVDAPYATASISGSGDYTGAIVANNLSMSGSGNFHYDESLTVTNSLVGNYAFVSWFEDNSDPTRNALDVNGTNHPIVY